MNYVTQFDLGTEIPKNFYESKKFKQLRENLENTNQSYFLTGRAGTGKSTFIEYFSVLHRSLVLVLQLESFHSRSGIRQRSWLYLDRG